MKRPWQTDLFSDTPTDDLGTSRYALSDSTRLVFLRGADVLIWMNRLLRLGPGRGM